MVLAISVVVSLALAVSCGTGRRGAAPIIPDQKDTAEFVPLHPPVVVGHPWRDTISE